MSIGIRLKQWRAYKKLTMEAASAHLGLPFSSLRKYELDDRKPGAEAMEAFLRAGINTNWLLSGDGPMLIADYSTKPVEVVHTLPQEQAACPIDEKRLSLAIARVEDELAQRRKYMSSEEKARVCVLAYQILEDEDKEKERAALEYAQKMIAMLMKTSG